MLGLVLYWVGGYRDGEEIAHFSIDRKDEAIEWAKDYYDMHEEEFTLNGGLVLEDTFGKVIFEI